MISYLQGTVSKIEEELIIVESNNIGYGIFTSLNTIDNVNLNEEIKIHTHLYVREDKINLFGFLTEEELYMFEKLIKISGVGPKAAIAILSISKVKNLKREIANENVDYLKKANGIGKKTAGKIILELKDKMDVVFDDSDIFETNTNISGSFVENALIQLGFNKMEIRKALSKIKSEGKQEEQIIKEALKMMGNR
ncbi:MAG: Holliday junction branch migration protein RuvA [Bacillota bacterium]|nr:Holliday junction branch migration protein RuvA [Bacillota bacterium]